MHTKYLERPSIDSATTIALLCQLRRNLQQYSHLNGRWGDEALNPYELYVSDTFGDIDTNSSSVYKCAGPIYDDASTPAPGPFVTHCNGHIGSFVTLCTLTLARTN